MIAFNALFGAAYLVDGTETRCEEGVLNGGSLYDFYETKDGKYLSFGGLEPQFFAAFCETIGRPDLIAGGVVPPDLPRVKEEVRGDLEDEDAGRMDGPLREGRRLRGAGPFPRGGPPRRAGRGARHGRGGGVSPGAER